MSRAREPRPSEAPLMTPAVKGVGGGGEAGWGGETLKWSKGGLALGIPPAF